jgi:hypothetical protein
MKPSIQEGGLAVAALGDDAAGDLVARLLVVARPKLGGVLLGLDRGDQHATGEVVRIGLGARVAQAPDLGLALAHHAGFALGYRGQCGRRLCGPHGRRRGAHGGRRYGGRR